MQSMSDSTSDIAAVFSAATNNVQLFGRKCTLLVGTSAGAAIDLSEFRIKFSVKRSAVMTPNVADIRIYNLSSETAAQIKKEFTQIILQAGYESNFGVIFRGNIKQVILGRENATDTFVDIVAGDGDRAYNFSIVSTTISAGSSTSDHVQAAISAMTKNGVTGGKLKIPSGKNLPRGKVIYDSAKNVLRKAADSSSCAWSIQDEQVQFLSETSYFENEVVVLNSSTGMIGTPEQTVQGVNAKCLLNPRIQCNTRIQINESEIAKYKLDITQVLTSANTPAGFTNDGVYFVYTLEHQGDTRGVPWYTNVVCLTISVASNPANGEVGSP